MICELLRKYPSGLTYNEMYEKTGFLKKTITGYLKSGIKKGYIYKWRMGQKNIFVISKRWLNNEE